MNNYLRSLVKAVSPKEFNDLSFEEPKVGYIQCKCGGEVEYDQNNDDWHDVKCPDCGRWGCFTRVEDDDED